MNQRDVFIHELFLERDRVRRDHRLALAAERVQDGRDQVGEGFPHSGAGFHDKVSALLKRAGDRAGHLLLLRPVFKIGRQRELAILGKNPVDFVLKPRNARTGAVLPK